MNLDNTVQLLKQSLRWRHNFPNDQPTKDPIFLFVYKKDPKETEDDIMEAPQMLDWMAMHCVVPIFSYLIVTTHDSLTSDDILKKFGSRNSNTSRYAGITVHNNPEELTADCKNSPKFHSKPLGESTLQANDHNPANKSDDASCKEGLDEASVRNDLQLLSDSEEDTFLNEPYSDVNQARINIIYDYSEGGDEVSVKTYTSPNEEQSITNGENMRETVGAKRWCNTTKRRYKNEEMHKELLTVLTSAIQDENGWKNVVVLADNPEFFDMITANQAVKIIKQLTLLKHAVCLALEQPEKSWNNIFEETAKHYCYENMSPITVKRTFNQFRRHKFKLPHPNSLEVDSMEKHWKEKADHFLETYPDLKQLFLSFSRENLRRFSVDIMHHFVNDKLMPKLKNEICCTLREKEGFQSETEEDFKINAIIKRQFGFCNASISRTTVYTWIRKLDFKYSARKKQISMIDMKIRRNIVKSISRKG